MENHKKLYKDYSSYNPRQNNRINRELLEANRAKQRRDMFHSSRNISPTPISNKKEVLIPLCSKDVTNVENINPQSNPNSTRLAKIVCNATNPEKLTKQEAFIKRFVEWKESKKNMKKEMNKKKPFVSTVNNGAQTSSSLVPRGHHREFRPPVGLKNILDVKVEASKKPDSKGRQSVYTVVPTPPRKQNQEKCTNKHPIVRKALPTNLHINTLSAMKTRNDAPNLSRTATKPKIGKTPGDNMKSSVKSTGKIASANTLEKSKTTTISAKPMLRKDLRPRVLNMPPPPSTKPAETNKSRQKGAVGKIREMERKRVEVVKQTNKSPLKRIGGRLVQTLKAKKTINYKKINVPALQINSKNILNLLNDSQMLEDMVIQTPRDFSTSNPFDEFVTSTKIKNGSQIAENEVEIRTTNASDKKAHGNSSAKRNIMLGAANTLPNKSEKNAGKSTKVSKKHNFIRYSEAADSNGDEVMQATEEKNILTHKESSLQHSSGDKTPTKCGPEERPANYLSPFVSVARGKVSLKKETEKRNSVYLQNTAESNDLCTKSTSHKASPKYSLEIRRTLEAVRYFRKQLDHEIDRLHKLCDIWEAYKVEHLEKIQNANGEDMINVTIGQTRLLTTKKFMQFKGLIDRCEAGATGIGAVEYDGSENTKPITSVDLEGFWSMLGLQVDNLEKRFENLNRWKLNDWKDPEEEKTTIKKNLTRVKKHKPAAAVTKSKPNSALQQMLRKMQAEMRKNKNQRDDVDGGVPTPSKLGKVRQENNYGPCKSLEDAPRRLSIVVKDRKYFSPSPTVISVSSTNQRSNNMQRKSSQDSPKQTKHLKVFNEALDNMQSSLGLRKSVLLNESSRRLSLKLQSPMIGINSNNHKNALVADKENSNVNPQSPLRSPVLTGRKSILKTPGTAVSRLRNVIFNEKLRVKKINFLTNEDGDPFNDENGEDANDTHEEDLAKSCEEDPQSKDSPHRTLTLRNRKVRLRPSSEIIVPK